MPKRTQKEIVDTSFKEAAIAFYLKGDWKNILRKGSREAIGSHKRLLQQLYTCDDNKFHQVISKYLEDFYV